MGSPSTIDDIDVSCPSQEDDSYFVQPVQVVLALSFASFKSWFKQLVVHDEQEKRCNISWDGRMNWCIHFGCDVE